MTQLDNHSAGNGRRSNRASLFWFLAFTTAGAAALAVAALLPEYVLLTHLQAQRDAVARQLECEGKLAIWYERYITDVRGDPVLLARQMMRYGNYVPPGCRLIDLGPGYSEDSFPAQLMRQAQEPVAPRHDRFVQYGMWVSEPVTRACMIVLSLGLVATGVLLFGPRRETSGR